jgi:hypothetical protein
LPGWIAWASALSAVAAERSGSTNRRSTPTAAGRAALIAVISCATRVRGQGHWPRSSSECSSIATMTAGALMRCRGISFW